jgi:hypothetical protein
VERALDAERAHHLGYAGARLQKKCFRL